MSIVDTRSRNFICSRINAEVTVRENKHEIVNGVGVVTSLGWLPIQPECSARPSGSCPVAWSSPDCPLFPPRC